jgi:polyvinyl alcohol dehydrogenase (cytochrome)
MRDGRARVVLTTVVGMALLAGACSSGGGSSARSTIVPTTLARGSSADSSAAGWTVYGHDLANTRRNVDETRITAASVGRLKKSWSIDGLVGVTGTPTVSDGVAYFDDWTGAVRAVHAATGKPIWTSKIGGMFVGAPAVDAHSVYASVGHTLYRLDRAGGAIMWKVDTDTNPFAQISASPVVVDGLVLQGTASFENIVNEKHYTFRGSIGAYDAVTGKQRWKFFTTPNSAGSGAGIGIWSTPAVDVKRGLLYVGTGQSLSPPTGTLADSILAIAYKTGKLRWSRQFTYPDVFSAGHPTGKDADVGASPNMWTSNGRDLVGAGDKGGTFHAVDRDTGAVVWETHLTPGSAFGGEIGSAAFVDGKLIATSNVGDPASNFPTGFTKVFALDPATGAIDWTAQPFPGKVFAPVSAVRGVAFVATDKGRMAALDTRTGKSLWTFSAPNQTACGPSIVDGRVLWGYGFVLFGPTGPGGVISFTLGS